MGYNPFFYRLCRFSISHRNLEICPMQLVINSPGTFITQKDECFRLKNKDKL